MITDRKRILIVTVLVAMLLVALSFCVSYTPTAFASEDTRIEVSRIVATSNFIPPEYGIDVKTYFTYEMTEGVETNIPGFPNGGWYIKEGEVWKKYTDPKFVEGTYQYQVQLRIDNDSGDGYGNTHKLADNYAIIINGVEWTGDKVYDGGHYCFSTISSPEFTVTSIPMPLEFADSKEYDVPISFINAAINPFSVARGAVGGTQPRTFSKTSGPEWIQVSTDGTISGTPTTMGKNSNLVIRVTDANEDYKEITVAVDKTYESNVVSTIIATSDFTAPVYDATVIKEYNYFTLSKGEPAKVAKNMGSWYKKVDEDWEKYEEISFDEGTYRYSIQVRIDEPHGELCKFVNGAISATINGDTWTQNGETEVTESYHYLWILSPEYQVVKDENDVYVGGVRMQDGDYLATGATVTTTTEPQSGYAYYKDGNLELNDYSYEGLGYEFDSGYYAGIYAACSVSVTLIGENAFTLTESDSYGIYFADRDISLQGSGSLDITAEYGMCGCRCIDVDECSITINSTYDAGISEGVSISITSGSLKIVSEGDGICDMGSISISGGSLDVSGDSYGVYLDEDLTIEGGNVKIISENAFGITADNVMIYDGNVIVEAEQTGVYGKEKVEIRGGEVSVKAYNASAIDEDHWAIKGTLSVSGSLSIKATTHTAYTPGEYVAANHNTYDYVVIVAKEKHTITLVEGEGYTIAPRSGYSNKVEDGKDFEFKVEIKEGYTYLFFLHVEANGVDVEIDKNGFGIIKNITSDVTIEVKDVFKKSVNIYGVTLEDGDYLASGADATTKTQPASGGYAYLKDGTLYLSDFNNNNKVLNMGGEILAMFITIDELDIELIGENVLSYSEIGFGCIYSADSLYFTGDGSLVCSGSVGVSAKEIIIDGGTYTFTSPAVGICSLMAMEDIIIYNGAINIQTSNVGIFSQEGDVCIYGGDIDITAGKGGVVSNEANVYVDGGVLSINAETGIWALRDVSVSGGNITIVATEDGIASENEYVQFMGGKVSVTAGYDGIRAGEEIHLAFVELTIVATRNGASAKAFNYATGTFDVSSTNVDSDETYCAINSEFTSGGYETISASTEHNGTLGEFVLANLATYDRIVSKAPLAVINGIGLYEGDYLQNGATETTKDKPLSGGYAHVADGVLTLNDYVASGKGGNVGVGYALVNCLGLEIVLKGNNVLTQTDESSYGIVSLPNLYLHGNGSLTISGCYVAILPIGESAMIEDSTIRIYNCINGIAAMECDIYIKNADVTITASNFGILADSEDYACEITLDGSRLEVTSLTNSNEYCAVAPGLIIIGDVSAKASVNVGGELIDYNETYYGIYDYILILSTHVCGEGEFRLGKQATCTEDGWKNYYLCDCDRLYEDEDCTRLISDFSEWKEEGGKIASEGHDYGNWTSNGDDTHTRTCSVDSNHKENGTCSGGVATCTAKAICSTCNTAYGTMLTHSHGSEWLTDQNNHWNECACGDKANLNAHVDGNADGKCDTCNYTMSTVEEPETPGMEPEVPDAPVIPDSNENGNGENYQPPVEEIPQEPSTEIEEDQEEGLSGGAIAGIAVGATVGAVGLGVGGFAIFWFVIKKKSMAELLALLKIKK